MRQFQLKSLKKHLFQPFQAYLELRLEEKQAETEGGRGIQNNLILFAQLHLLFYCTFQVLLTVFKLTDFQRLLFCDFLLFYSMPARFNWIFILFSADSMYFLHSLFSAPSFSSGTVQLFSLLHQILFPYQKSRRKSNFFINSRQQFKGRPESVSAVIQYYFSIWMYIIRYFSAIGGNF